MSREDRNIPRWISIVAVIVIAHGFIIATIVAETYQLNIILSALIGMIRPMSCIGLICLFEWVVSKVD